MTTPRVQKFLETSTWNDLSEEELEALTGATLDSQWDEIESYDLPGAPSDDR